MREGGGRAEGGWRRGRGSRGGWREGGERALRGCKGEEGRWREGVKGRREGGGRS